MYPHTNDDRDFNALQKFIAELDDPNIIGRARYEPSHTSTDFGNVIAPAIRAPRTPADVLAEHATANSLHWTKYSH